MPLGLLEIACGQFDQLLALFISQPSRAVESITILMQKKSSPFSNGLLTQQQFKVMLILAEGAI